MNQVMQQVVAGYKHAPTLTHKQEVQRLYRSCLRNITSWAENRDVFNEEATKVREEFNKNMNIDSQAKINRIMRESRERLDSVRHPDPYIASYMPGGTLFMRNPSFPVEALYPDGVPEGVSKRRVNIDMSNIADDEPYSRVFVDSANKQYWIDK